MKAIQIRSGVWLGIMAVLLGGLLLTTGCEEDGGSSLRDSDVGANNPDKLVALGDSITAGTDGVAPYPSLLPPLIGMTVVNAGVGGQTAAEGLSRAGSLLRRETPGFMIIFLGSNDAIDSVPADTTIANLRTIVQQARANQTVPILTTLPPMMRGHSIFNGHVRKLNPMIRDLASSEHVPLADVANAFGDDATLLSEDGLHPNQQGQQVIAQVFANKF